MAWYLVKHSDNFILPSGMWVLLIVTCPGAKPLTFQWHVIRNVVYSRKCVVTLWQQSLYVLILSRGGKFHAFSKWQRKNYSNWQFLALVLFRLLVAGAEHTYSQLKYTCEFFSSLPRPERLWGLPSLLSNGYQGLFPWGKTGGAWSWPLTSI
jgi:hypothetical protein